MNLFSKNQRSHDTRYRYERKMINIRHYNHLKLVDYFSKFDHISLIVYENIVTIRTTN